MSIRIAKFYIFLISFIFSSSFFYFSSVNNVVLAENNIEANNKTSITVSKKENKTGKTVEVFDKKFAIKLLPGTYSVDKKFDFEIINENIVVPEKLKMISQIYQYDIKDGKLSDNTKPLSLEINYDKASIYYKKIYFYNKPTGAWLPVPSEDFPLAKKVVAKTYLNYSRVAVFEDPNILAVGYASWYSHKSGMYAASPDYKKGTILRVQNLENNKYITVEVNDFGPDRNAFPDRVIDLDKVAFAKLSALSGGKIKVKVEPIDINNKLVKKETSKNNNSLINAKSAVIINNKTGDVLYAQNESEVIPLASLTKIVAVKVFLDYNKNLNKTVVYKKQDEEYNYKYVDYKWESARLKVSEGETMTIRDLLYAALIGSANNSVESLVRVSGMSREVFIKKMNKYVAGIGAKDTYFVEPTGLSPKNVSSALDYSIITKDAYLNKTLAQISSTAEYDFQTINTKVKHHLRNTDSMVHEKNGYKILGTKTGYLIEAGHCLMVKSAEGNKEVVGVVMNAGSRVAAIANMKNLLKIGFSKIK